MSSSSSSLQLSSPLEALTTSSCRGCSYELESRGRGASEGCNVDNSFIDSLLPVLSCVTADPCLLCPAGAKDTYGEFLCGDRLSGDA